MEVSRPGTPTPEGDWNAASYHRVSDPQVLWGRRVLERVALRGDECAVDAGCGTGRLTEGLCEALPRGRVIGVDRSIAMAAVATVTLGGRARVLVADLLALPLADACVDLVFSTATFHWLRDHDTLFSEIHRVLVPGGRLVAQCGGARNLERVQRLARGAADLPTLRRHFRSWTDPRLLAGPAESLNRLERAGFTAPRAWLEDAPTCLPDRGACAEFLRTVTLRPWLARLAAPDEQDCFVDHVLEGLAAGRQPWLLDYRRLNLEATRA